MSAANFFTSFKAKFREKIKPNSKTEAQAKREFIAYFKSKARPFVLRNKAENTDDPGLTPASRPKFSPKAHFLISDTAKVSPKAHFLISGTPKVSPKAHFLI